MDINAEDAELGVLEEAYSQARGNERDSLLFTALVMCQERLPAWVFKALTDLFGDRRKLSAAEERWAWARALLDANLTEEQKALGMTPLKWEDVFERVSQVLTFIGRPAKAETVRKSYDLIERSLPKARRRPRTYRRRR